MIKKYKQFVKENIELSNSSARIYIDSNEVEMFDTEPVLQNLISDEKVSLSKDSIQYDESDPSASKTKEILDQYLEIAGKTEEEFNESVNSEGKKELDELAKRIKELQKEYDKKAKELGVQNVPKKEYNWRDLADWHPSRRTPGE
jgi:flagellar biosynthesis chaperone FliJ